MKKQESAMDKLRKWILDGRSITPMEALKKWGMFRLSARICQLRDEGIDVNTELVKKNGKQYAKYSLV